MSDELYFDDELKKCLITSAFPDCLRDWWYQRIHRAHDATVDRVTDVQRNENTKLRELVRDLYEMAYPECPSAFEAAFADRMRELGVEVDE